MQDEGDYEIYSDEEVYYRVPHEDREMRYGTALPNPASLYAAAAAVAAAALAAVGINALASEEVQRALEEGVRRSPRRVGRAQPQTQPGSHSGPTIGPVPDPEPWEDCDDDDEPDHCLVGPYSRIYRACRALGGQRHHIVPDMVYRYRAQGAEDNRVPNAPTRNQGQSICLTRSQHRGIHNRLRSALQELPSAVPGTAPMVNILSESTMAIHETETIPPDCKARAQVAASMQVTGTVGLDAPGRTIEWPLPSGEAFDVLQRGHY